MTEITKRAVIRVQDVMFRRFEVMDGFSTVADAIRRMRDTRSKALFVSRRDPEDEWGILLLSDIAKKVLAKDRSPERVNVYEIMTKPVLGVPPEMDIRYCVRLFEQFGISFAPVMQGREIIGTVRYADMVLNGMCQET
jgi:signal-transduction protein with cAMP-binding, CBS, and nucleotidyltransferase domain